MAVENRISIEQPVAHYGRYIIADSLVIFTQNPFDKNFLPDTLLLDRAAGFIYLRRDSTGGFSHTRAMGGFFTIDEDLL